MSEASRKRISSQALEDGPTRSSSPDGDSDLFGRALAPVSPSVRRGTRLAPTIPATFGLPGATSLASVALQRSLENRLRAQTDVHGSTWFTLTWRRWDTPSGRRLCVLLAKARPTRVIGF